MSPEQPESRQPTMDGRRTELVRLMPATALDPTTPWWRRWYVNLSLFLAGMYTGVKCSGVPHEHHTYRRDRDRGPL